MWRQTGYWRLCISITTLALILHGPVPPTPAQRRGVPALDQNNNWMGVQNFKNANNVRFADQFPGVNAAAKIAAAVADLPSSGGTVVANFEGNQAISNTIVIDRPVRILLGAATFAASSTAFDFQASGELIGLRGQINDGINNEPTLVPKITYSGNAGPAIRIQTTGSNQRVHVILKDLSLVGNRDVFGATSGGNILFQGGTSGNRAIAGFEIENVAVVKAKGSALEFRDGAFEGTVINSYFVQSGGAGIFANNPAAVPGSFPTEIRFYGVVANNNASDGFDLRGGGTFSLVGCTASNNGSVGAMAQTTVQLFSVVTENNTAANVQMGETGNSANGSLVLGLTSNMSRSGASAIGLHVKNATHVTVSGLISNASGLQKDLVIEAASSNSVILGYRNSHDGTDRVTDNSATAKWLYKMFQLGVGGSLVLEPTGAELIRGIASNGNILLKAPTAGSNLKNWMIQNNDARGLWIRRVNDAETAFTTIAKFTDRGIEPGAAALGLGTPTAQWDAFLGIADSKRYMATHGTVLTPTEFALSAAWGSTATVTAVSGTDQRFRFTVKSSGAGQTANPTITLTFRDGPWSTAPFAHVMRNGGNQAKVVNTWATTATTLVITFHGTPVAGELYTFEVLVMG